MALTQQIMGAASSAASGDNTTGHVISAAAVGGGLASIISWFLQVEHLSPPPEVTAGIGIVCTAIASFVMQKLSN